MANNKWLSKFSSPNVDVLASSRSDHCPMLLNIANNSERRTRTRIFRHETKWSLEDDGEETIQSTWQNGSFSPNCWTNIQSKLSFCNRKLVKWFSTKKKLSK